MSISEVVKFKNAQQPKEGLRETAFNLPNGLTGIRILLIPIFVVLFLNPTEFRSLMAAAVFGIAALTDLLDGYIARRREQVTTIGRLLDPIADKLLVLSGLILLVQFHRIESWIAIVLIAREIGVTGIRAVAASEGIIVAAGDLGKIKVFLQIIAILFLILQESYFSSLLNLAVWGTMLLYLAMIFSLISGAHYLVEVFRKFTARNIKSH